MAGRIIESLSTDLSTRVYRVTNGFNEALYLVTNEPSLGMFRLQEHVQLTVPKVVEQRQALQQVRVDLHNCSGTCILSMVLLQPKNTSSKQFIHGVF